MIVGFGVAAASIYRRVQTLIERRALAEDLLEAAVAALEDRGGCPGRSAAVLPCARPDPRALAARGAGRRCFARGDVIRGSTATRASAP